MSIYKCPKGHESSESDFCSECGAKIQGIPGVAIAANPLTATVQQTAQIQTCPDCTAPHDANSGDFCEICGYNFVTGGHGEVPMLRTGDQGQGGVDKALLSPLSSQSPVTSRQSPLPTEAAVALEVVVTIDPSLSEEGSPPPPANLAPLVFRLDKHSHLIGRTSDRRGIHPEVALDFDEAVSHRHALLLRQPDGTFILRDIGSTNGTKLNGSELTVMVDAPIKEGDEFTLGYWTRIAVKAVRQPGN